jgi:branched-chain amino acid aminotransferase
MTQLWCNAKWMDAMDFAASPTDRGLTVGLGLFETILAIDGRPIAPDRHLARLRAGCERLGWETDFSGMEEVMVELIHRNDLTVGRARVRLAISGGSGKVQSLALGMDHVVWMTALPVAEPPVSSTANLSPWPRNENSPLAGLKCASYAENLIALEHAHRLGFEETIFLNTSGQVCEAATSNLFLVQDGEIITPPLESGCLPGVMRSLAIELAAEQGIACHERVVDRDELHRAHELFLTSAIRGIMGLARFESRMLTPGPVTMRLRDAWHAVLARKTGPA